MNSYLLPANPLGKGYDDAFSQELMVLRDAEITVGTVDHDELVHHDEVLIKLPVFAEETVEYRGWMVTPEQYVMLSNTLIQQGRKLATSSEQFIAAHRIDGWLHAFQGATFDTVLIDSENVSEETVMIAADILGAQKFFVKDYVKSRKDDASLSIAETPEDLHGVVQRLISEQGDWFVGGVAIRAFQELADDRVEVRGWWRDGRWVSFTNHPDYSGSTTPIIPEDLLAAVTIRLQMIDVRFVSVDFTVTADGDWIVIEVGDGQVSGLPEDVTAQQIADILNVERGEL